jgi:hypothetical protein
MGKPPGRSGSFKQATHEIEAEVKKVLDFVEERVVPRARRDGEKMLRRLAEEMHRWADHLHDPPAPNPPPGAEKK